MIYQETLLRQLHLLMVNNEICCYANLKLISELKVAINRLKWMTIGDETINDLLGIGNHFMTCVNWFIRSRFKFYVPLHRTCEEIIACDLYG